MNISRPASPSHIGSESSFTASPKMRLTGRVGLTNVVDSLELYFDKIEET